MSPVHASADPRLAAVRTASDPEALRALLEAWFRARDRSERVAAVDVQRVFYMPGSDFHAVYEVRLESGSRSATLPVYGSIRYEGDAAALAAKAERKAAKGKFAQPELGAAAYHLPELDMVLWSFPNDPRLKTLVRSLQLEASRPALGAVAASPAAGHGRDIGAVSRTLVRYIPRKRCVFRYEIEWREKRAPNGEPISLPASSLQTVYAKVYDGVEAAAQASELLAALWKASQTDRRWLGVPAPLHCDAELWTVWQTAVPGAHLTLSADRVSPALVGDIGRGLALLQQAQLPLPSRMSLEDELEKLRLHARLVAMVHPEFEAELSEIESRLVRSLESMPRLPLLPAHGTFKLNHLLYDGLRPSLVDFDSMVLADPLYDVANFTADLHYLEAMGSLPPGRALKLAEAFHEAWAAAVPWGRREALLDWYVASLLVRKQALKCVKHLHGDAVPKIACVLAEAARRIGRSEL